MTPALMILLVYIAGCLAVYVLAVWIEGLLWRAEQWWAAKTEDAG